MRSALAISALVLSASAALAQQPPAGGPARAVLALRQPLALTDDQVKRLESLASSQQASLRPDRAAQLRARADFLDAQQKDNLDGERAALDKMARLRTDAVMARLKARKDVKDVLTAEQRDTLQTQFRRFAAQRRMRMGARAGVGVPGGAGPAGRARRPMRQPGFGPTGQPGFGGPPGAGGPPRP